MPFQQPMTIDRRTRISDTTTSPYGAIAKITTDFEYGTGWFISPTILVTAAHVLFHNGQRAQSVSVDAALNGEIKVVPKQQAQNWIAASSWDQQAGSSSDYGAIQVPTANNAWFDFGVYSDQQLQQLTFEIVGYPVLDNSLGIDGFTMWRDAGQLSQPSQDMLYYTLSTSNGQSGSPIFHAAQDGKFWAAGIHVDLYQAQNKGVRITQGVFDMLNVWKQNGL
jgi:glutamyl endopeptidase